MTSSCLLFGLSSGVFFCKGGVIIYGRRGGANRGGINFSARKLRGGQNFSASLFKGGGQNFSAQPSLGSPEATGNYPKNFHRH